MYIIRPNDRGWPAWVGQEWMTSGRRISAFSLVLSPNPSSIKGRQKKRKRRDSFWRRRKKQTQKQNQIQRILQRTWTTIFKSTSLDFNHLTAHLLPEAVIYLISEGNQPSTYPKTSSFLHLILLHIYCFFSYLSHTNLFWYSTCISEFYVRAGVFWT